MKSKGITTTTIKKVKYIAITSYASVLHIIYSTFIPSQDIFTVVMLSLNGSYYSEDEYGTRYQYHCNAPKTEEMHKKQRNLVDKY